MAGLVSATGTFGGASADSSTSILYYLATPQAQGTFGGASADANTVELDKTSDKLYIQVTDQYGNALPFVLVKIKWTRSDNTTYESYYYTDKDGWISVPVPSDVVGADIYVGNVSQSVTDPQSGGYYSLTPTVYLTIRVVDSSSKKPIAGVQVDLGDLGTYVTDANGEIRVSVPSYGEYTAKIYGGYRYFSQSFTISVNTDTTTRVLYIVRKTPPIVR